jgi:hypothetical protein
LENQNIISRVATATDKLYSKPITDEMEASAAARGTGIAKRSQPKSSALIKIILGDVAVVPPLPLPGVFFLEQAIEIRTITVAITNRVDKIFFFIRKRFIHLLKD